MAWKRFFEGAALAAGLAGVSAPDTAQAKEEHPQVELSDAIQERITTLETTEHSHLESVLKELPSDDVKTYTLASSVLSSGIVFSAMRAEDKSLDHMFSLVEKADYDSSPFITLEGQAPLDFLLGKVSKLPDLEAGMDIDENNEEARSPQVKAAKMGDKQVVIRELVLAKSQVFDGQGKKGEEVVIGLRLTGDYL